MAPRAALLAAALLGLASADIQLEFNDFIAAGASFTDYGAPAGVLTAVDGSFTMVEDGEAFTWADDLTVLFMTADQTELHVQIGGFSDFGATYKYLWPYGAAGGAGTEAGGLILLPISIDVTGYNIWLGNGYGSGGDGQWTGTIDLVGIEFVDNVSGPPSLPTALVPPLVPPSLPPSFPPSPAPLSPPPSPSPGPPPVVPPAAPSGSNKVENSRLLMLDELEFAGDDDDLAE